MNRSEGVGEATRPGNTDTGVKRIHMKCQSCKDDILVTPGFNPGLKGYHPSLAPTRMSFNARLIFWRETFDTDPGLEVVTP
jgi:hypothetical protein